MRHFQVNTKQNFKWNKLITMMLVVFFLYFGDAILSDWIPTYMQNKLGGSLMMGLMMSFSSIIGFGADLIFPQLFKKATARKMILLAVSSVLIASGFLLWTTHYVYLAIFILAMGVWGLYYEFLNFGLSGYVVRTTLSGERAGTWSVINVFRSTAYCLGPLAGSWLYYWKGDTAVILVYGAFAFIAYVVWLVEGFRKKELKIDHDLELEKVNIIDEMSHWVILIKHLWTILLVSLVLGIVDSTFWTVGVVMSDKLVQESWVGSFFVPAYVFPSIFIGFLVARLRITNHKKKIAEMFMLLTGALLFILGWGGSVYWLVILSLLIGLSISVAWPMVEAVYTDILSRMGSEQKHLMGLSSSMYNISYITGPVIVGVLANLIGEIETMKWLGVAVMILSIFLLMVTPRKLKLPQKDIGKWDRDK